MDEVLFVQSLEQLRILADPHRLSILRHLMQGPATITQVGRKLGEEPAKVRYHIKELERVGLVHLVEKREKGGNLEKYYQAVARTFALNLTILSSDSGEQELNALTLRMIADLAGEIGPRLLQGLRPGSGGWPIFHGTAAVTLTPERAEAFSRELRALLERFKALEGGKNAATYGLLMLLYRTPLEAPGSIVATGSHDLTLDLLARRLAERHPGAALYVTNVGSLGGLLALHKGAAHLAGSHLLDPETGEYNVPYVRRLLPGLPVVLVNLVLRQQGLMVRPGNPLSIATLRDLIRPEVTFVNRERGSGTRVLLDWKLREAGIEPSAIRGYDWEESTHLAVAAAIASGRADAGLGILAAARTYGLDFIPILKERYDLVIPRAYYEGELLRPLLDIMRSSSFQAEVEALGGYDASMMGQVMAEVD